MAVRMAEREKKQLHTRVRVPVVLATRLSTANNQLQADDYLFVEQAGTSA